MLAYHAGIPRITGGFIGVDVFFVISGFLITGLLVREIEADGTIDFIGFYARRARRLLPAALVVIVATVALAAIVLPSVIFTGVGGDAAASALYVSNYRFALAATDYFSLGVQSPLLHYWSLGVEEQFYLFWPVLILAGWRLMGRARLPWLIVAITIASFVASVVITGIQAPWAFYSLPTRAWQLGLGALIALGWLTFPKSWPVPTATLAGLGGLGLIVAATFLIKTSTPYPGWAALAPAVGAALVVASGERRGSIAARLLSIAPARWMGRISYSLYLWHWPLLILVPAALGREDPVFRILLAIASIGVAHLSTRYIEQPFRSASWSRFRPARVLALAGGASVSVAVVAVVAMSFTLGAPPPPTVVTGDLTGSGPKPTLPPPILSGPLPADIQPPLNSAYLDLPALYAARCSLSALDVQPVSCVYGVPSAQTTVVVYGDSHAAQWMPAIDAIGKARSWRVELLIKTGCPAVNLTVYFAQVQRDYTECAQFRDLALQRIEAERPVLTIVGYNHVKRISGTGGPESIAPDDPQWITGMTDVLRRLHDASGRVVFLGDSPQQPNDPVECLARNVPIEQCTSRRADVVDPAYEAVEKTVTAETGVDLLSTADLLCPADVCPLVFGQYLVYRDQSHITATFATVLAPSFAWALEHT